MIIPEIGLKLVPHSKEAKDKIGFKWAGEGVGQRSKLGGSPGWIQKEIVPRCSCGQEMTFYGQLDSIGDDMCLADCGMIYIFVCFDCCETMSILQSLLTSEKKGTSCDLFIPSPPAPDKP
jgi:hypothetical protein